MVAVVHGGGGGDDGGLGAAEVFWHGERQKATTSSSQISEHQASDRDNVFFVNSLSAKSVLAGEKLVATYSIST